MTDVIFYRVSDIYHIYIYAQKYSFLKIFSIIETTKNARDNLHMQLHRQ